MRTKVVEALHQAALINALAPFAPCEYVYRDECFDAGGSQAHCACGHPIRFIFPIYHPSGRTAQVGSTCIEHYAQLSPEAGARMLAAERRILAQIAEAKSKAKRAAADAENAALWSQYSDLRDAAIDRFRGIRERGCRASRELWYFAEGNEQFRVFKCPPPYIHPASLRKWLNKAIRRVKSLPLS